MIYFFCTLYPQTSWLQKKRGNARKNEIVRFRWLEAMMSFPASRYGCGGGIFHCPLENTAAVFRKFFAHAAPCFLPCRAPFFRHRRRSRSKPAPSSFGGRSGSLVPTDKKKKDANASFFLLARSTEKDII